MTITRKGLNTRIRDELTMRANRGDLVWKIDTVSGRIVYVITPGRGWASPKPPALMMSPGLTAEWLGLDR